MKTTIDQAGRLVVPKEARDRLGIKPGDQIEIVPTDDGLRLTVVHESPRLVKEGNVLVFAAGGGEAIGDDVVGAHRDLRLDELVGRAVG